MGNRTFIGSPLKAKFVTTEAPASSQSKFDVKDLVRQIVSFLYIEEFLSDKILQGCFLAEVFSPDPTGFPASLGLLLIFDR